MWSQCKAHSPIAVSGIANSVFSVAILYWPWTDKPTPWKHVKHMWNMAKFVNPAYFSMQRYKKYSINKYFYFSLFLSSIKYIHHTTVSIKDHLLKGSQFDLQMTLTSVAVNWLFLKVQSVRKAHIAEFFSDLKWYYNVF